MKFTLNSKGVWYDAKKSKAYKHTETNPPRRIMPLEIHNNNNNNNNINNNHNSNSLHYDVLPLTRAEEECDCILSVLKEPSKPSSLWVIRRVKYTIMTGVVCYYKIWGLNK